MSRISEWLVFSDIEIGTFQYFFRDYFIDNEKKINKFNCYQLGRLAGETQYQMRVLKERILKGTRKDDENDRFIEIIESFPNLIEYISEKFIANFESMGDMHKFKYLQENKTSFFNLDESTIAELKMDINKIKT